MLLSSCDSLRNEVDPELLNRQASKLVVTCFLSPQDSVLAVKVSRSQTVLSDSTNTSAYDNIPGAVVTLSEGDRTIALYTQTNKVSSTDYYRAAASRFPIIAGRTYKLVVQTAEGERAESSCTIPKFVKLESLDFDSTIVNQIIRQQRRYFVRAHWQDPADETNFYQIAGNFQYVNSKPDTARRVEFRTLRFDTNTSSLQTDDNSRGAKMESERAFINGRTPNTTGSGSFLDNFKLAKVVVDLLSIDRAYYNYQYAVGRQAQASGNPFAEPVLIPSNIQGGLGCFAGYNKSTVVLTLK
ncbi:hypothetical protein GCM10027341_41440 [Spirosoma knui]